MRAPKMTRAPRIRSAPRRTRVVVRKIGPLSVLKFSLLFYLCVMLIVLFAMVIVYGVLSAAGAIDSLETVLGYVFGEGTTSTGGAEPIEIDGGTRVHVGPVRRLRVRGRSGRPSPCSWRCSTT